MSDYDVLVVGSGIAGLSIAVRLSRVGLRVGVVTKASLSDSTTIWAQGGVAAVLGGGEDSKEEFIFLCLNMKQDTVYSKSYVKRHQIL